MSTGTRGEAASFAHDECPIDLHYLDDRPILLDVESMTRRGQRVRRQKAAMVMGTAAVVVGVSLAAYLGISSSTTHPSKATNDTASAISATGVGEANPPTGQVVVLAAPNPNAQPTGQSIVAWVAVGDRLCMGSIDISDPTNGPLLSCEPAPSDLVSGGPALESKPTFRAGPAVAGRVLAIGFVRGPASTAAVTMSGVTTTGAVVALGGGIGGYAVWLPTAMNTQVAWSAISKVVAEDSHGRVIATLP